MVEPLHSFVADVAVAASGSPDYLAIRADVVRVRVIEQLLEVDVRVTLDVARVT